MRCALLWRVAGGCWQSALLPAVHHVVSVMPRECWLPFSPACLPSSANPSIHAQLATHSPVRQVPIVFVDRVFGASKLGGAEIVMYLQVRKLLCACVHLQL